MLRLLRENITKIAKSATFWIFFSAYVVYSILVPIILRFTSYNPITEMSMDILALCYGIIGLPIPAVCVAFICSVIFGVEFQNGTIKNKIILGHKKINIYVANLLTTSVIAIALNIVYLLFFCVITLPMFGKITAPSKNIVILLLDGALMLLAYCAIFTFITMTSKNSIVAMIVSLALIIASYFIAIFVFDQILNIMPYIYVDDEFFGIPYRKKVPNPELPSKAVLDFCQFMMDFLPTGQCWHLTNNYDQVYRWQPALYSLCLIGATSGAGMLIFNKTNLK